MVDALTLRRLGDTGLEVTGLALGCSPLGSDPGAYGYVVEEARAIETVKAMLASPLNFLDTAAIYGHGESERRVGDALRQAGDVSPNLVIATKADRDPNTGRFDGPQVRRSVAGSLERLGVGHLQLVHLHDPEYALSFEEAMKPHGPVDALVELRAEGVISYIGVAAGPVGLLTQFVATGAFDVVLTHNRFTLIDQSAQPLLDAAMKHSVAVVNAAPYGSGVLAKGSRGHPRYGYRQLDEDLVHRIDRLTGLCEANDVPLAAAALQFSLREPRIASTVVGMTRPERVAQTIALASHPIPDALWEELLTVALPTTDPRVDAW